MGNIEPIEDELALSDFEEELEHNSKEAKSSESLGLLPKPSSLLPNAEPRGKSKDIEQEFLAKDLPSRPIKKSNNTPNTKETSPLGLTARLEMLGGKTSSVDEKKRPSANSASTPEPDTIPQLNSSASTELAELRKQLSDAQQYRPKSKSQVKLETIRYQHEKRKKNMQKFAEHIKTHPEEPLPDLPSQRVIDLKVLRTQLARYKKLLEKSKAKYGKLEEIKPKTENEGKKLEKKKYSCKEDMARHLKKLNRIAHRFQELKAE